MKAYKLLYNHDMCSIASNARPGFGYDDEISRESVMSFVDDVCGTDVDAFMCCPNILRLPLWPSKVEPHWRDVAPYQKEPSLTHDWKYFEYVYYRVRRYILAGGDPVADTVTRAKEKGVAIFFSYRMNDTHMLDAPDSPNIDAFWRDHPEYRIGDVPGESPMVASKTLRLMQNWLLMEVREHYYAIFEELLAMYDVDGLEFDLMRSPAFFPPERVDEGRSVFTDFVRRVRALLDRVGEARGKRLQLSVRVPPSIDVAYLAGLDVRKWDAEGLIDIVNVNSSFYTTVNIDIEGYKAALSSARVVGEMQFAVAGGKAIGTNTCRKMTCELFRTFAQNFLERGADGLSLYNFTFTRHHYFSNPRRFMYPGFEPPFDVLKGITDIDFLRAQPKHYYFGSDALADGSVGAAAAQTHNYGADAGECVARCAFDTYDDLDDVSSAKLRVETRDICHGMAVTAYLNGVELSERVDTGELFRPLSVEALPIAEQTRYFDVPPTALKPKGNELILAARHRRARPVVFTGVELALYRV